MREKGEGSSSSSSMMLKAVVVFTLSIHSILLEVEAPYHVQGCAAEACETRGAEL